MHSVFSFPACGDLLHRKAIRSGRPVSKAAWRCLSLCLLLLSACLPDKAFAQVNLALTATASHSGGGTTSYGPANYNDDVIPACASGCSTCSLPWGWVNGGGTNWIEFTWPTDQVFYKVVFHKSDRPFSQTKLQYWNGTAYVDIVDYNSTVCPVDSIIFPPVTSARLRFYGMTGASNPSFREIQVFEKLTPCSGKPVAGTAIVSASTLCPGDPVTLNLSGYGLASGLTYEWDTSSTGTGSWGALSSVLAVSSYTYRPPSGKSLYYRCRLTCTASGEKDTSSMAMATAGPALLPPYSETFEGITVANTFPDCMKASRIAPSVYSYLEPTGSNNQINHTPGGSKYVSFRYSSNDYLFTPALNLEAGKIYRLSFWYITDGQKGWTALSAKIGNAADAAAMSTTLRTDSFVINERYEQFIVEFTVPSGGDHFIGIQCVATSSPDYLSIDDINLIELPPCNTGTLSGGSHASATPGLVCNTPGTALLSLSSLPPFSELTYQWEQATGSPSLFAPVGGATTTTYTATVTTNTYFRCKITCSATGEFVYSDTAKVLTPPFSLPYREDFESGKAGVNMPCASAAGGTTVWSAGSLSYWDLRDGPYSSYPAINNHTPGGSKYLYSGSNNGPYNGPAAAKDNYFWFTPALAMEAGKSYKCSFWFSGNGSSSSPAGFRLGIYAGTAQTAAGMSLRAGGPDTSVDVISGGYRQIARSFTAPATGGYYIGIKTVHTGYNYPGVPIDDIGIDQNPSCSGRPNAGIADADPSVLCGSEKSILRLSGTSEASDLRYQWLQSVDGPSGPWTAASGGSGATAADYTTPSLGTGTWYRCVVKCSISGLSDTSSVALVQANGIIPPYRETFETTLPGSNAPCAATSGPAFGISSSTTNWTSKGFPYAAYATIHDNHTPGGSNYLWAGYYLGYSGTGGTPNGAMWFTPAIRLVKDSSYEFSFWYQGPGYTYRHSAAEMSLYYGTAQTEAAMTNAIRTGFVDKADTYRQMLGRFKAIGNGNYYLGIKIKHTYSAYSYYGTSIDDIGLEQLPACKGVPTAGVVYALPEMLCSPGTVALDMNYERLTKASGLSYRWEWTNADPAAGTFIPAGSSTALRDPQLTSPPISTTTWFRCVVICDYTGELAYSDPLKVDVGIVTPPYIQTFEFVNQGENAPCASNTGTFSATSTSNWGVYRVPINLTYPSIYNHTPRGTAYLMGGSSLTTDHYWFTPKIRLSGGKDYVFSYWYSGSGNVTGKTTIGAYYGLTNTAAGMTTAVGADVVDVNEAFYKKFERVFTPASSGDYYLGIKIRHTVSATPGVAIDDIGLQEILPCSAPVAAGKVIASPPHVCSAGGTTTLNLEGTTLATGLSYEWLFATDPEGPFVHTGGTGIPYTTDPVTTNTWYKAVVTCTATGASDTTEAIRVSVNGLDLPYIEDFETTGKGEKPLCSEATTWGTSNLNGWYVNSGTLTGSYTNRTPGGNKYLQAGYYMGYTTSSPVYPTVTDDNFWFTPGLNLSPGYTYNLSFWYVAASSNSYNNRIGVFYGKAQTIGAMTNTIIPFKTFGNLTYERYDTTFTVAAPGVYYLGFQESAGTFKKYNYAGVAFDDINLNYAPCNGMPFAGSIRSSVAPGTPSCINASVALTARNATVSLVPGIRYQWMRRPLGSGSGWSLVAGATDSVLRADTLVGYEYRFAVICSNTNDTAYSSIYPLLAHPVHPPVSIVPSTSPVRYCLGDTVRFNATNYKDGVYDWMLDGVVQYGWKFSDMGATEPGEYVVRVTSPLSPCPAYSNSVKLNINDPGYAVEISTPADSIICEGSSVLLTAIPGKGGLSMKWRRDNIDIPFATGSSYLVTRSGYYRVVATDGSSLCPAVSRNIRIIVQPNPEAKITVPGGALTACEGEGVVLKANAGYSYEWLRGGSTMSGSVDDSLVVKNSGAYRVKVRTSGGCINISAAVTVNILPAPRPVITKTILGSGSIELSTGTFPAYQWYRNGVLIPGATAQTLSLTLNGLYRVRVTSANNCEGLSDPIELNEATLSIGDPGVQAGQICIYPNPAQSVVFIESPVAVRVSVKDITGRTILSSQEVKEVDLGKYPDGVYLFTISDKEGHELIQQQRVTKLTK